MLCPYPYIHIYFSPCVSFSPSLSKKTHTPKHPHFPPPPHTHTPGEIEVIKSILKTSLPHLIGWEKMMNISTEASITQTFGNKSDKYEFVGSKQQQQQQGTKSGFFSGGSSKGEFDF